ncbi:MAG: hypothetical protein ABFC96_02155 [Thermoguttaceae bacterium]
MSPEMPSPCVDVSDARIALKEIVECHAELELFLTDEFDRWERLADELLTGEVARHETLEQAERAAMDELVQRLASVATELTESLGDRKRASKAP